MKAASDGSPARLMILMPRSTPCGIDPAVQPEVLTLSFWILLQLLGVPPCPPQLLRIDLEELARSASH
jgi:hypothetical protein